jgi:hypothetical protein
MLFSTSNMCMLPLYVTPTMTSLTPSSSVAPLAPDASLQSHSQDTMFPQFSLGLARLARSVDAIYHPDALSPHVRAETGAGASRRSLSSPKTVSSTLLLSTVVFA